MKLKAITIACQPSWASDNPNKWIAQVKYESPTEETSILLSQEASLELLAFVGPLIAKRAAEAAAKAAGWIDEAVKDAQAHLLPEGSPTIEVKSEVAS